MAKEFDYLRILKVDYAAYFSFLLMMVFCILYAFIYFLNSEILDSFFTIVIIIPAFAGLILLVRRMQFLKYLYGHGVDAIARVDSTRAQINGGSNVEFSYEFQGESYHTLNELTIPAFRKYGFLQGDEVVVRIDREHPDRAVIRDLYFFIDQKWSSHANLKMSESVVQMKLDYWGLRILPVEFVAVDIWTSYRINTNLSPDRFMDAVMEFGRQNYAVDENRSRILIRNNFVMETNYAKILDRNIFTFKFLKYHHRIYSVHYIVVLILFFTLVAPHISGYWENKIVLYSFFFIPIGLIWITRDLVRSIKKIKPIDYGKEAEGVYSEILAAVREKEKGTA